MDFSVIEELKQLFRTDTGLDAEQSAADFAGWLFIKRQQAIINVIEDLKDREQNQPATVKLVKSIMNRLLMISCNRYWTGLSNIWMSIEKYCRIQFPGPASSNQ